MKSKDPEKISMSDEELRARNATAYWVTSALFVGSLITRLPFYFLLGVDDQEPWPAITSLVLSVVLPTSYLMLRQRAGGPTIEEFLHYCELKDGFSRSAQLAIYAVWVVFVVVAVPIVLMMSP
jgi:hypothetical protein